jgi:hypothetical protein
MERPSKSEPIYYVYAIRCKGVIIYIGKGCGTRAEQHLKGKSSCKSINILKMLNPEDMSSEILEGGLTEEYSLFLESELISAYGYDNLLNSRLTPTIKRGNCIKVFDNILFKYNKHYKLISGIDVIDGELRIKLKDSFSDEIVYNERHATIEGAIIHMDAFVHTLDEHEEVIKQVVEYDKLSVDQLSIKYFLK